MFVCCFHSGDHRLGRAAEPANRGQRRAEQPEFLPIQTAWWGFGGKRRSGAATKRGWPPSPWDHWAGDAADQSETSTDSKMSWFEGGEFSSTVFTIEWRNTLGACGFLSPVYPEAEFSICLFSLSQLMFTIQKGMRHNWRTEAEALRVALLDQVQHSGFSISSLP